MPEWVTAITSPSPFSPVAATAFMSFSRMPLNGCLVFHSGCFGASAFTRSKGKNPWTYVGCSLQRVPSLSKTAMRAAGATNWGLPWAVTAPTNFTIACLAAPSFQDGKRGPSGTTPGARERDDRRNAHETRAPGGPRAADRSRPSGAYHQRSASTIH